MALAGIERGRGTKEKRLERVLSEGKKNDRGVMVLRGLGPNMHFRDLIGQFKNVLDLSDICPILGRGNRVSYAFCNFHKERKWESFFFYNAHSHAKVFITEG